jgi:hypothetical protein
MRAWTLAATLASALGATSASAAHYKVVARCAEDDGGPLSVKVALWTAGQRYALYIYERGRLLERDWAARRTIESGPRITRIGYSTGSPTAGGADLRIRTRDTAIAANEGSAHLTTQVRGRIVNARLHCSVF